MQKELRNHINLNNFFINYRKVKKARTLVSSSHVAKYTVIKKKNIISMNIMLSFTSEIINSKRKNEALKIVLKTEILSSQFSKYFKVFLEVKAKKEFKRNETNERH